MSSPVGPLARIARQVLADEQNWAAHRRSHWGIKTGFPSWEKVTKGVHPGEYIVLAARPSSGKTSLQLQVAMNVIDQLEESGEPGRVMIFAPEMNEENLFTRMVGIRSRVSSILIKLGRASAQDRMNWRNEAVNLGQLDHRLDIWADEIDIVDLVKMVEAAHQTEPVKLVVVDYIQIIGGAGRDEYQQTTRVSRSLRSLANRLNVPILALSQLSRPADRSRETPPTPYEIRNSGNVEQDADVVMTLYRPLIMDVQTPHRDNTATVTVFKNRNGMLGSFKLFFLPDCARFEDLGQVSADIEAAA